MVCDQHGIQGNKYRQRIADSGVIPEQHEDRQAIAIVVMHRPRRPVRSQERVDAQRQVGRIGALAYMQERHAAGEMVTGLLFVDPNPRDMHAHLKTVATPLNALGDADLVPGAKALEALNASLR